jgi:hypothetical protein
MLEGRVVRGVDANASSFRNKFKALPSDVQTEAIARFKAMFGAKIDEVPRAWHLHQLNDKKVPSRADEKKLVNAWSMHLNAADTYKASFTLEDMTVHLRTCGPHDKVDKTP